MVILDSEESSCWGWLLRGNGDSVVIHFTSNELDIQTELHRESCVLIGFYENVIMLCEEWYIALKSWINCCALSQDIHSSENSQNEQAQLWMKSAHKMLEES